MPSTISVDHTAQRVYTAGIGQVTYQDVIDHLKQEELKNGLPYSELIDATGATTAFSADEIRRIADYIRVLGHNHKLGKAAIIVKDDVTYGMSRMLCILLEDVIETNVFRDKAEAINWLGW
jgi:hypothetical protein